jgi:outer membrane murein-binding lipoprotein Lpp
MKTNKKRLMFMPLWVIISVFIIAACSTEKLDDLETDVQLNRETRELSEDIDLKQGHAAQNQLLAQIRRATAKYHKLDAAVVDGYGLDPHCVEHPEYGGMGHHAVNMDRIGPFVNPVEPGVLVYEPMQNGKYRLVAVEYLVPAEPWDAMYEGTFPMLGNVEFDDHREIIFVENEDGELVPVNAKGGPPFPHYQLHVWVWKNNPNGMYFPFNPNVSCDFAFE